MKLCDHYQETIERKYLTDFEQGVIFAKTGQRVLYKDETVCRCRGTKEMETCSCHGNPLHCDFYPEKRKLPIELTLVSIQDMVGKTIQSIKVDGYCVKMTLNDGTVFDYSASDGEYSCWHITKGAK